LSVAIAISWENSYSCRYETFVIYATPQRSQEKQHITSPAVAVLKLKVKLIYIAPSREISKALRHG